MTHPFGINTIYDQSAYLVYLAEVTILFMKVGGTLKTVTNKPTLNMSYANNEQFETKNKSNSARQEHLSRISRAGLRDITVVDSIAATVTSWKKLARKAEKLN